MTKKTSILLAAALLLIVLAFLAGKKLNLNPARTPGQPIDSLNGVVVYYNGGVGHSEGRNRTPEGYNLGMKYQCVEFVKRYYYESYGHKMPDSYGHAKDFFDPAVEDGAFNARRGLRQFTQPSQARPQTGDLLVFSPTLLNPYGHVAIVARVHETEIEIIQQNPGPFGDSRERFALAQRGGKWEIGNRRIRGWLRK